jgi:hypothetical protein
MMNCVNSSEEEEEDDDDDYDDVEGHRMNRKWEKGTIGSFDVTLFSGR